MEGKKFMKVANLFNEIGRYFEKRNAFSKTSQAVKACLTVITRAM